LQFGGAHPLRAFLNGRTVYDGTPGSADTRPDQVAVPVEVKAGRNVLLIEVHYRGPREAVYARFLDLERKLTYPEPAK
jgi:hypothetical protein